MVPGVKMRLIQLQVQKDSVAIRIKCNLVQLQLPHKGRKKTSSTTNVAQLNKY